MTQQERAIVSIWLPHYAIDRWSRIAARRGDEELTLNPAVLVTETAHGPVIDATNPLAQSAGARAGMRLADARAMAPGLAAYDSDHEGNQRTIERMALAAQRWGPWSMIDGPDALLVEATSSAHLFGGEVAMLAEIEARFASEGYTARAALAPTGAAAWALSHYGADQTVLTDVEAIPRVLAPLPSSALRINADTQLLLTRLGLKVIGDLLAVPRESLARRFRDRRSAEANPLIRLDQLLGRTAEPFVPLIERPPLATDRRLLEPVLRLELVLHVVADLAVDLCRALEADKLGARRVMLTLWRVDGEHVERSVELALPSRDPKHLGSLFAERLEGIDPGFGFDQMRLTAVWAEVLDPAQDRLDQPTSMGTPLPMLVDRLVTRLGSGAVSRLLPRASHLPERAQRRGEATAEASTLQYDLGLHARPLKLLDRPEAIGVVYVTPEGLPRRFRWRGGVHDIVKVEGPERIAPEWWRERSTARLRDYYRIEDGCGRRYWIFRHGLVGDGRGGVPDWFLHGLFA
jgi:protein ImuB